MTSEDFRASVSQYFPVMRELGFEMCFAKGDLSLEPTSASTPRQFKDLMNDMKSKSSAYLRALRPLANAHPIPAGQVAGQGTNNTAVPFQTSTVSVNTGAQDAAAQDAERVTGTLQRGRRPREALIAHELVFDEHDNTSDDSLDDGNNDRDDVPMDFHGMYDDSDTVISSASQTAVSVTSLNVQRGVSSEEPSQPSGSGFLVVGNVVNNSGMSHSEIRALQDAEYAHSLLTDRRKVNDQTLRTHQEDEEQSEEHELQKLRERRRLDLPEEPLDGFTIQIRGGTKRRFRGSDSGEVLRNFIGSQPGATRFFKISSYRLNFPPSWELATVTLADLGINGDTVVDVLWGLDGPVMIPEHHSDEDDEIGAALSPEPSSMAALSPQPSSAGTEHIHPEHLQDVLKQWRLQTLSDDEQHLSVSRDAKLLWEKCVRLFGRSSFDPKKTLTVSFRHEEGQDGGGILREFFEILFHEMLSSPFFEQTDRGYEVALHKIAFTDGTFKTLGVMLGCILLQGGPVRPVFSHHMIAYAVEGRKAADISTVSPQVREKIQKIQAMTTEQSDEDLADFLTEQGISVILNAANKQRIVSSLISFNSSLMERAAMLDEFWEGAEVLGLRTLIREHRGVMESILCYKCGSQGEITAESLVRMLRINRIDAEKHSNQWRQAEKTADLFEIFIYDCEDGKVTSGDTTVTVGHVLQFLTGASTVPPGMSGPIDVHFTADKVMPVVSTCVPQVVLPIHHDPVSFRKCMVESIIGAQGFGRP